MPHNMTSWTFDAFKTDDAVWSGLAAQQQLIDAIAPYSVATGTAAAGCHIGASTWSFAK